MIRPAENFPGGAPEELPEDAELDILPDHPFYHCYVSKAVYQDLVDTGIKGIIHHKDVLTAMSNEMKVISPFYGLPGPMEEITFAYRRPDEPTLRDGGGRYIRSRRMESGLLLPETIDVEEMVLVEEREGNVVLDVCAETDLIKYKYWFNLRAEAKNLVLKGLVSSIMPELPQSAFYTAPPEQMLQLMPGKIRENLLATQRERRIAQMVGKFAGAIELLYAPDIHEYPRN